MIGSLQATIEIEKDGTRTIKFFPEGNRPLDLADVFENWIKTLGNPSQSGTMAMVDFHCSNKSCAGHFRITFFSRKRVIVACDDGFMENIGLLIGFIDKATPELIRTACGVRIQ